jgi:hypothetical protein
MPPSGYSIPQAKSVSSFLHSVSTSLKEEGKSLGLTPQEALKREINHIKIILKLSVSQDVKSIILKLTEWLYIEILSSEPSNYDEYDKVREEIIKSANMDILDIHVPTISTPLSIET